MKGLEYETVNPGQDIDDKEASKLEGNNVTPDDLENNGPTPTPAPAPAPAP